MLDTRRPDHKQRMLLRLIPQDAAGRAESGGIHHVDTKYVNPSLAAPLGPAAMINRPNGSRRSKPLRLRKQAPLSSSQGWSELTPTRWFESERSQAG